MDIYMLKEPWLVGVGSTEVTRIRDRENKQAIFKNFSLFTGCIRKWKKTKIVIQKIFVL